MTRIELGIQVYIFTETHIYMELGLKKRQIDTGSEKKYSSRQVLKNKHMTTRTF